MAAKRGKKNKVSSSDKYKVWLIAGISVVVVVVAFLLLYSPVRGALFGKVAVMDLVVNQLMVDVEIEDIIQVSTTAQQFCEEAGVGSITGDSLHYCGVDRASWCNPLSAGEGVDNNLHPERYLNNYVCDGTQWQSIEDGCLDCAGREGFCVGSNIVDVPGEVLGDAYYNNIEQQVGCVRDETQCVYGGEWYYLDENLPIDRRPHICGEDNNWLSCNLGAENVAESGSKWLCYRGQWIECDENEEDTQRGRYICSLIVDKWQWFSEFGECNNASKYIITRSGQDICDGENWRTCEDAEELNERDSNVEISCVGNVFTKKELICNDEGVDDDRDGDINCADLDCRDISYTFDTEELYEVVISEEDCVDPDINVIGSDGTTVATPYVDFNVCDTGTERILDSVAICAIRGTVSDPVVLTSVETLSGLSENNKPYHGDDEKLTLLYKNPTNVEKSVSIIFTQEIVLDQDLPFPLGTFSANLLYGQRLMLILDGEYYLLSHQGVLYDEEQLTLTHIPTEQPYQANVYAGTQRVVFNVLGDKSISVERSGSQVLISAFEGEEVAAAYVVPGSLEENFEISFTRTTPVRIETPELDTFSICRADEPADKQVVKVCRDNEWQFDLRKGELISKSFEDFEQEFAFFYDVVGEERDKQVSIFSLTTLSEVGADLDYNNFLNAMIAGKRAAFKFEDKLYLAEHPLRPEEFSLLDITFYAHDEGRIPFDLAAGTEDQVEYIVFESGRIALERGTPERPFYISALTFEQQEPIILENDLSTSMSSLGRVLMDEELVQASPDDNLRYADEFWVLIGDVPVTLPRGIPHEYSEDILFYYHTAQVEEDNPLPIKTVAIYKYYDVTDNVDDTHVFDEEFIATLAGGKEIALKMGDNSYYLLSHEGKIYQRDNLRLRKIGGESYEVSISEEGTPYFMVDEGKIIVEIVAGTEIKFSSEGEEFLITEPFTRYFAELTTTNRVQIGDRKLKMCSLEAYADYTGARICGLGVRTIADLTTVIEINDQEYLLESNGQRGDTKKVFIREIIELEEPKEIEDWNEFANEVINNEKPLFNVSRRLYLPHALTTRLDSFGLGTFPTGFPVYAQVTQTDVIAHDGYIILRDKVVFISQEEEDIDEETTIIQAEFSVLPYTYLPDDRSVLELIGSSGSVPFAAVVGGEVYNLTIVRVSEHLVRLKLDGEELLFDRLFAPGDTKVLYLDNVPVEINVGDIEEGQVTITIQKR